MQIRDYGASGQTYHLMQSFTRLNNLFAAYRAAADTVKKGVTKSSKGRHLYVGQ